MDVLKLVLEFATVTVITIIAERYLSNTWAFVILGICLIGLGILHREWLLTFAQAHRVFTILFCTVGFAAVGLGIGILLSTSRVPERRVSIQAAQTPSEQSPPQVPPAQLHDSKVARKDKGANHPQKHGGSRDQQQHHNSGGTNQQVGTMNAPDSVISFGQQGGITARTVIVKSMPDLEMSEDQKTKAEQVLEPNSLAGIDILLFVHQPTTKTTDLGNKLKQILMTSGATVTLNSGTLYPPVGQVISPGISFQSLSSDNEVAGEKIGRALFGAGIVHRPIPANRTSGRNSMLITIAPSQPE
jgi:hypothetical protein